MLKYAKANALPFVALFLAICGSSWAVSGRVNADSSSSLASNAVYACVTAEHNTLNLSTKRASCPAGQTKIAWNRSGPDGDRGARGAQGGPGAQGERGADGVQGDVGATGPMGGLGPNACVTVGAQGPQGPKGPTGAAGAPGPPGASAISDPSVMSGAEPAEASITNPVLQGWGC